MIQMPCEAVRWGTHMDVLQPDWMHVLAGEIQCVAGLIQVTDDHTATAAQYFIARVPDPASPIEELLLRDEHLDVSLSRCGPTRSPYPCTSTIHPPHPLPHHTPLHN